MRRWRWDVIGTVAMCLAWGFMAGAAWERHRHAKILLDLERRVDFLVANRGAHMPAALIIASESANISHTLWFASGDTLYLTNQPGRVGKILMADTYEQLRP